MYQEHFTFLHLNIFDGITRFSGILSNMMERGNGSEDDFPSESLMCSKIELKICVFDHECENNSAADFLKILRECSFNMVEVNKAISTNTLFDKLQHIKQNILPQYQFFEDDENNITRDNFLISFCEVFPSELGQVMHRYFGEMFLEVENLFKTRIPANKIYTENDTTFKNIQKNEYSKRLGNLVKTIGAVKTSHIITKGTASTASISRKPYANFHLYCTWKIILMMIVIGKYNDFVDCIESINKKVHQILQ